jgi:hypothetical protein
LFTGIRFSGKAQSLITIDEAVPDDNLRHECSEWPLYLAGVAPHDVQEGGFHEAS